MLLTSTRCEAPHFCKSIVHIKLELPSLLNSTPGLRSLYQDECRQGRKIEWRSLALGPFKMPLISKYPWGRQLYVRGNGIQKSWNSIIRPGISYRGCMCSGCLRKSIQTNTHVLQILTYRIDVYMFISFEVIACGTTAFVISGFYVRHTHKAHG